MLDQHNSKIILIISKFVVNYSLSLVEYSKTLGLNEKFLENLPNPQPQFLLVQFCSPLCLKKI